MSSHDWDCAAQSLQPCDCGLDEAPDCIATYLASPEAENALAWALQDTDYPWPVYDHNFRTLKARAILAAWRKAL